MIVEHLKETAPGVASNCVSGAAWVVALVSGSLPYLHALSLLVAVIASGATAGYYFIAWRNERKTRARRRRRLQRKKAKR